MYFSFSFYTPFQIHYLRSVINDDSKFLPFSNDKISSLFIDDRKHCVCVYGDCSDFRNVMEEMKCI